MYFFPRVFSIEGNWHDAPDRGLHHAAPAAPLLTFDLDLRVTRFPRPRRMFFTVFQLSIIRTVETLTGGHAGHAVAAAPSSQRWVEWSRTWAPSMQTN